MTRPEIARGTWCSAEEAITSVEYGTTIGVGHVGAEPLSLTQPLWAAADRLRDVTVVTGMMLTGYRFLNIPDSPFRMRTWFMPGTLMSGDMRDVRAEYLPLDWTQTARYLMSGVIDTAIIQVSEVDADGYYSLGIATSQHWHMAMGARRIIAEVNPRMPRTLGEGKIHGSKIDMFVKAEHELIAFPNRAPGETEKSIGRRAAEFVPNGCTVQFGIGSIPSAMLYGLIDLGRKDLRILSQITDPARDLIEAGCCVAEGPKAVVGKILGSIELYDWAHENPDIQTVPALQSHAIDGFARRGPFVSVNSALEIDLFGQLNSEWMGGRQIGAIGGAMDFGMAAQFSGNLSIIALNSVTNKGKSRIVAMLGAGPVSVPRSLVQVVVTEYGAVDLRNKTVGERAAALASISHPDHREELAKAARALIGD